MQQITSKALNLVWNDEQLQVDIAKGIMRQVSTVKTWFRNERLRRERNEPLEEESMVTSRAVVLVIKDLTGLEENEIIEEEPVLHR